MPAGSSTKQVFAKRHKPPDPVVTNKNVTPEMVERFLFNSDAFVAYAEVNSMGDNFAIVPKWIVGCEEGGVTYLLCLTLLVLIGRGAPIEVGIPEGSELWKAIVTASEIKEVIIKRAYPARA